MRLAPDRKAGSKLVGGDVVTTDPEKKGTPLARGSQRGYYLAREREALPVPLVTATVGVVAALA
jgi:hypothetical protein